MLSILVPARNGRAMTEECLRTILSSLRVLRLEDRAEFILMDDNSDPALGIADAFRDFRAQTAAPVSIFRFKTWQHYTGVFAYGLSRARGSNVLFVSNDMRMTPGFLRTVIAVSALDASIGIVRGTSENCDSHPEHDRAPDRPLLDYDDEVAFAERVAAAEGLRYVEDRLLSGDAVLVRRALIDRIGVMDRQFFGYMGDPDYGLRAQRAGFRLVCAKGAWLVHTRAGHVKEEARARGIEFKVAMSERMHLVATAYLKFREKWDKSLPPAYTGIGSIDFERLRTLKRVPAPQYQPPLGPESSNVEVL